MHYCGNIEVIAFTGKSVLVQPDGSDAVADRWWVPFSQIEDDESEITNESEVGDEGELVITDWLAERQGLG